VLNPQRLIADIDAVFLQFPDLAEDEELRAYVIEHGTDFKRAIQACMNRIREARINGIGIKAIIEELGTRWTREQRAEDAMRSLIQKIMEHAGASKFMLPEATLSIGKAPRSVIITDESKLPPEFVRTKTEPDKAKIKSALLDGEVIEGAELSNGGQTLVVRTK
jgi:hypothetical protein